MALLSRAQIDRAPDIKTRDEYVEEWGGEVRLRGMTGTEKARINGTMVATVGMSVRLRANAIAEVQLRTLCSCIVDEEGNKLYAEDEYEDLGKKSAGVLERLYEISQDISGATAEAVEEAEEDFDETPSEPSTSD
jgi:hypothetical protein